MMECDEAARVDVTRGTSLFRRVLAAVPDRAYVPRWHICFLARHNLIDELKQQSITFRFDGPMGRFAHQHDARAQQKTMHICLCVLSLCVSALEFRGP